MKKSAAYFLDIRGQVQGVGFRPFIYNLALKMGVCGRVYNDGEGVKIKLVAPQNLCVRFIEAIKNEAPPLSFISSISVKEASFSYTDFKIVSSKDGDKTAPILPDFGICEECKREFYDPHNRRYHHPLINCTHCGPRFSIIKSLPYDRQNTSMAGFAMCGECQKEYKNPADRRYHAQPICCPKCGPQITLKSPSGELLATSSEAVCRTAAKMLANGDILAVKGLGGFHLMCDATNPAATAKLRERKRRAAKPFAIMCQDLQMVRTIASPTDSELAALQSIAGPIILMDKKQGVSFLEPLAPGLAKIGIFLAPTALNLLIFEHFKRPLIATSANVSGEPIIADFENLGKIAHLFDAAIDHDRPIIQPSDDSVGFVAGGRLFYIRTSRGLKPRFTPINQAFCGISKRESPLLALGAQMKNQFAFYANGLVISSNYIGDMQNLATLNRYKKGLRLLLGVYNTQFYEAVGDLHPQFLLNKEAREWGLALSPIQHHEAHILSVIFEHNIKGRVLGFGFDGTGYGKDGGIWGGEVLWGAADGGFERVYKLDNFGLIGGDNGIKNVDFVTFAVLKKCGFLEVCEQNDRDSDSASPTSDAAQNRDSDSAKISRPTINPAASLPPAARDKISAFLARLTPPKCQNLNIMERSAIKCSSFGRLFDAAACLVLGIDKISFDAEAAMRFEALYDAKSGACFEFSFKNGVIQYAPVFEALLTAKSQEEAASGFINGVARLILDIYLDIKSQHTGSFSVVLGGGCFQNAALLNRVLTLFEGHKITPFLNQNEPLNDGAIALGQLYFGLNNLKKDTNE